MIFFWFVCFLPQIILLLPPKLLIMVSVLQFLRQTDVNGIMCISFIYLSSSINGPKFVALAEYDEYFWESKQQR